MGAPGERLVSDPQSPLASARRGGGELLGEPVDVVNGVRGDRGAHQDRVHAQAGHDVELVLGAAQVAGEALRLRGVQVPEGLVQLDRQPEVGAPRG